MAITMATASGNSWLDVILNQTNYTAPTAIYLSLHTSAPGLTGANEVTDATYARQNVTASFPAAASKSCANNVVITFPAATTGFTATHFGLWSASTAGTFYCGDVLSSGPAVGAGEVAQFASGAVVITAS